MVGSTRDIILEKAADLLERQGYHGTALNQIVQESGTPRGSLYYYFPEGKEELAAEAVVRRSRLMNESISRRLRAHDDPVEAIVKFALGLVEYLEKNDCDVGAPFATVTLESPATGERVREACQKAYERLRAPFEEKLRDGGFTPERAASLSLMITAALEGAIILGRAQQSAEPVRHVAAEIRHLLECARR
ncbi:MAG: TetR/AcrR family transcriptional regulator [Candidatus Promineifilaceae bacterium]|nr:TetR/AcrR family transcriptional regulator [Candidatus Promineifilaceae bacterium]